MGNSVIKTISISTDLQKFLDENPDIPLSKITQKAILDIKENKELFNAQLRREKVLNEKLFKALNEAREFIASKNLNLEYNQFLKDKFNA